MPLDVPGAFEARPPCEADYPHIVEALTTWWDLDGLADQGALRIAMLPRLFVQHFADTSRLVFEADARLAAFLVGFLSQTEPRVGYIHFVGVAPSLRQRGLARWLYAWFFDTCRRLGRTEVRCITSPSNTRSLAFHQHLGFSQKTLGPIVDYDGPGQDRLAFVRYL